MTGIGPSAQRPRSRFSSPFREASWRPAGHLGRSPAEPPAPRNPEGIDAATAGGPPRPRRTARDPVCVRAPHLWTLRLRSCSAIGLDGRRDGEVLVQRRSGPYRCGQDHRRCRSSAAVATDLRHGPPRRTGVCRPRPRCVGAHTARGSGALASRVGTEVLRRDRARRRGGRLCDLPRQIRLAGGVLAEPGADWSRRSRLHRRQRASFTASSTESTSSSVCREDTTRARRFS